MRKVHMVISEPGKHVAAVVGVFAVETMVTLTVASGNTVGSQRLNVAGSGDGTANGMYTQPSVAGMNLGATATFTTPSQAPATEKAVPAH